MKTDVETDRDVAEEAVFGSCRIFRGKWTETLLWIEKIRLIKITKDIDHVPQIKIGYRSALFCCIKIIILIKKGGN